MDLKRLTVPQGISLIAIAVVALAAFLPWESDVGTDVRGVEGDGILTLVLAVLGAVHVVRSSRVLDPDRTAGRNALVSLVVMAVVVAFIGWLHMDGAAVLGLCLTLFAGLAWCAGALWELETARRSTD